MTAPSAIEVVALSEAHSAAWEALFIEAGAPCFCRYWHFEGTKNEWLERCAVDARANALAQRDAILAGRPDARGMVALEEGRAVGWMKLAPRAALAKLTRQPAYRSAAPPGDDASVLSVGCFLVAPDRRRRGIARALLAGGEAHARAMGVTALEAYPRASAIPLHDEEAYLGPEAIFLEAGFAPVGGEAPYALLRKDLRAER